MPLHKAMWRDSMVLRMVEIFTIRSIGVGRGIQVNDTLCEHSLDVA